MCIVIFFLPGWEPKKDRNLTSYVRPEEKTIKLSPLIALKVGCYFYRKKLPKYKELKSTKDQTRPVLTSFMAAPQACSPKPDIYKMEIENTKKYEMFK